MTPFEVISWCAAVIAVLLTAGILITCLWLVYVFIKDLLAR